MKHGYYSRKMEEMNGTAVYARENGSEVHVTSVHTPGEPLQLGWDDVQWLGPVERYVRPGRRRSLKWQMWFDGLAR